MMIPIHMDCMLLNINVTDFYFFKERNKGVVCSNQIELVQVTMIFF